MKTVRVDRRADKGSLETIEPGKRGKLSPVVPVRSTIQSQQAPEQGLCKGYVATEALGGVGATLTAFLPVQHGTADENGVAPHYRPGIMKMLRKREGIAVLGAAEIGRAHV